MSDVKPDDQASGVKSYEPLSLLWGLVAIGLSGWLGGALGEYWYGAWGRGFGVAIGYVLGFVIAPAATKAAGPQVNAGGWVLAMMLFAVLLASTGREQSLSTELGRLLGLAAGIAVFVLAHWGLAKWQRRRASSSGS